MQVFFQELLRDGQIDRAMTEARFAVREHPDHWVPVLFTRLVTGRLWYEQRFAKQEADFEVWEGLLEQIQEGTLVPILGAGLLEPYVGSPADIARRLAEKYQYPLASSFRDDLPQVAQYLSVMHGKSSALSMFANDLADELLSRWPDLEAGSGSRRRRSSATTRAAAALGGPPPGAAGQSGRTASGAGAARAARCTSPPRSTTCWPMPCGRRARRRTRTAAGGKRTVPRSLRRRPRNRSCRRPGTRWCTSCSAI